MEPKEASPSGKQSDTSNVTDPLEQIAAITGERDALVLEKAELNDRLLRTRAEFDNFRRRVDREKSEILDYASMDTSKALLPVIDDLERALQVECSDKEFGKGMELIVGRLVESLKKLGLEPIEALGTKFDPNLHHAIEKVETKEAEDQTILAEFQKGYNFKGRLLRPALVKVAVE